MNQDVILTALQIIGPAVLAVFGFMAKSVFESVRRDIKALGRDHARLEGQISAMQSDLRAATATIIQASTELKAVWRFIDSSHQRASDGGKQNG